MRDVRRDRLRWTLKRIAMGLAVSPLTWMAGCQCYGPCAPPFVELQGVTRAQLELHSLEDCLPLCGPRPARGFYEGTPIACRHAPERDASVATVDAFVSDSDAGPDPIAAWIECTYRPTCIGGRRPASGVTPLRGRGIATWLAETAQLEAASVDAFAELRSELIAHRAPSTIITATSRAEADEVVHARIVGAFARRAGAEPVRPSVAIAAPRTLFDVAEHNASEGCVREAFGAINALHQASNAATPALREGFLRIARDEARHALLSLDLDDWIRTKLDPRAVRRLDEAREVAAHELAANVGHEDHETRALLGLPDEERGRDLVRLCA